MRSLPLHAALFAPALAAAITAAGAAGCVSDVQDTRLPYELQSLSKRPLGSEEKAVLDAKSFVLSTIEPLSYHEGYAAIFKAHEPVYFTADAVLHALHSSFDSILAELETQVLSRDLGTMLDGLRAGLARDSAAPANVRADVDVYLAVAKSLLNGTHVSTVAGGDGAAAASITEAAEKAAGPVDITLFGARTQDFSMMKPRGHYTKSAELTQYFRAMMWLGTFDVRLSHKEADQWKVSRDAVRGAVLLQELATPEVMAAWQRIDKASQVFVGPADSMSLPGLSRAMSALRYPATPIASMSDEDLLRALRPEASQKIRGGLAHAGEESLSFRLLGQRFVFDSQVFVETTYGNLDAYRMMPSPLDVAAAVFKNPVAETLLAPELDRYGYRDALHAAAREGDSMGPSLWEGSIYHGWLRALSKLSPDAARDKPLPPVFRGEPWQRRMLSTQLSSWAELRHDTILYAKQSYTAMALCDYPDGYVDPYPEFWAEIEHLAKLSGGFVQTLDFGEEKALRTRILKYFERLGGVAGRLGQMASLERQNLPLTDDDVEYLRGAVSIRVVGHGCTVSHVPVGWHAELYFDREDILKREPIIADVHTQPTDESGNMVGRVLHVATGHPRQMTITIQTDTGSRQYRGLVGSYHEIVTSNFERLNDAEWRTRLRSEAAPPDPAWLSDLVAKSAIPKR
jgi:hypothetical protein